MYLTKLVRWELITRQVIIIEEFPVVITAAGAVGISIFVVTNDLIQHLDVSHVDMALLSMNPISISKLIINL